MKSTKTFLLVPPCPPKSKGDRPLLLCVPVCECASSGLPGGHFWLVTVFRKEASLKERQSPVPRTSAMFCGRANRGVERVRQAVPTGREGELCPPHARTCRGEGRFSFLPGRKSCVSELWGDSSAAPLVLITHTRGHHTRRHTVLSVRSLLHGGRYFCLVTGPSRGLG